MAAPTAPVLKKPPTRKGLDVSKGRTRAPSVVCERYEVFSTSFGFGGFFGGFDWKIL